MNPILGGTTQDRAAQVLDGLGCWWMVQDPARGAAALTRFWEALG